MQALKSSLVLFGCQNGILQTSWNAATSAYKQSGIRGADLNIIQAVAIAEELSVVTWREILWSDNSWFVRTEG